MRHDQLVTAIYDALNTVTMTAALAGADYADAFYLRDETGDTIDDETGEPIEIQAPIAVYAADAPQIANSERLTDFPFVSYLIVGDRTLTTKLDFGMSALVQVDVWHRTPSMAALTAVSKLVFEALNRQPMPAIDGHIDTFLEDASYVTEPDGKTKRAVLEFRVTSLPTS